METDIYAKSVDNSIDCLLNAQLSNGRLDETTLFDALLNLKTSGASTALTMRLCEEYNQIAGTDKTYSRLMGKIAVCLSDHSSLLDLYEGNGKTMRFVLPKEEYIESLKTRFPKYMDEIYKGYNDILLDSLETQSNVEKFLNVLSAECDAIEGKRGGKKRNISLRTVYGDLKDMETETVKQAFASLTVEKDNILRLITHTASQNTVSSKQCELIRGLYDYVKNQTTKPVVDVLSATNTMPAQPALVTV
ncbi:MAG: hypothetical protein KAT91_03305 [Candidatus Aenigmarchaeota archaeon]|nr:hypothetical protein [Candidatus Aenigmarchaeota archaeon]